MSDVGDIIALTLTVDPADITTTATVAVTKPDLTVLAPPLTASTDAARATWTAALPLTAAGEWLVLWTVTGTGASAEPDTVYAFALPAVGECYATRAAYAAYTAAEPPAGVWQALRRASRKLDAHLVGARYPVDAAGLPTEAVHIAALRDACCAQVAWWAERGDPTGSGVGAEWGDVKIGDVSLSRSVGSGSKGAAAPTVAPDAVDTLRVAGLLPVRPYVYG